MALPWPSDFDALVYILGGQGAVGGERRPAGAGQLAVFGPGDAITFEAASKQDDAATRSRPLSWEASPSASPSPGTARS